MSCIKTLQMMNDYLDKTLSKSEEQIVKRHLEECKSCRSEYQNLEKADHTLRQVICEMVADIVVPNGLSDRIEMNLSAANRKNTLLSRLSVMLKTPAAAAALLFVVLAAGFLTYNNFFNLADQQKVAMTENTESAGVRAEDNNGAAVGGQADPLKGVQVLQAESDLMSNTDEQLDRDAGNAVKVPVENQPDSMAGILSGQPPAPAAATAPEALSKSYPAGVQRRALVTSAPPGMGESMAVSNSGTMEEAVRDVGFIPVKPAYLPQGAVLSDVSWFKGEVSQNYRAGKYYFTVSQSRFDAADFEYEDAISQGSAVDINGMPGFIQENRPEPGGNVSGDVTTLRWRQGDWAFSVSGDLPAEELIKISTSLK
ncbi:zf-HC2 domain-containing protein [Pelotomaculum propionicicum]